MMRRRKKNKSISFMTAVVVEVGSMLGIVAVAQPTWTGGLIERIEAPTAQAVIDAVSHLPAVDTSGARPVASTQPASQSIPSGWYQPASHVAQLDSPAYAAWNSPAVQPREPVLPPSVTSVETPPWGSGNGWIYTAPSTGYNLQ